MKIGVIIQIMDMIFREMHINLQKAYLYRCYISHNNEKIQVRTNSYRAYMWMENLLKKVYLFSGKTCSIDKIGISIDGIYSKDIYNETQLLLKKYDYKFIYSHHYQQVKQYFVEGFCVIENELTGSIIAVANDHSWIYLINNGEKQQSDSELSRIVREVITRQNEMNGKFLIHGATVEKDGHCYIITGAKGSGKTTLLLELLSHGYNIVGNDRVFVNCMENGYLDCETWPGSVAMNTNVFKNNADFSGLEYFMDFFAYPQQRLSCMELLKSSSSYTSIYPNDKVDFSCQEIASIYDVEYLCGGRVEKIINIYYDYPKNADSMFLFPEDCSYPNWLGLGNYNEEVMRNFNKVKLLAQKLCTTVKVNHNKKDIDMIMQECIQKNSNFSFI